MKKKHLLTLLATFLLSGIFAQGGVSIPSVFTDIGSGTQTLSSDTINGNEKWYKWLPDTGIVQCGIKLIENGINYQTAVAEIYTLINDSLYPSYKDSINADSTINLYAGYVAKNQEIYIHVINVNGTCTGCIINNPVVSLMIENVTATCPSDYPCSIVGNGGFEQVNPGHPLCGYDITDGVNCWYPYENSADVFRRNCTANGGINNLGTNTYNTSPILNSHNGSPNNTIIGEFCRTPGISQIYSETVQTLLTVPLVPGHSYELSYWVYNYSGQFNNQNPENSCNPLNYPCWLTFAATPGIVSSTSPLPPSQLSTYPSSRPKIHEKLITSINVWTSVTYTFTMTGTVNCSNLLVGPNASRNLNDGYNNRNDNIMLYLALDDINIKDITPVTVTSASTCPNQSIYLYGNGANSYTWQPGNYTGTQVNVSTPVTTVYTVTPSYAPGCLAPPVFSTVTIKPTPNVTVTASNYTICPGATTTLTAGGASLNNYVWTPCGTPCSGSLTVVSPSVTTTYTVEGFSTNGCTKKVPITITVLNPTITVIPTLNTICAGQTTTLVASGANTYTWLPSGIVSPSLIVSPATTTQYTVVGTNTCGLSASKVVTVTVNNPNSFIATAQPSVICAGNSSTLTASGVQFYTWMPGNLQDQSVVSPTVTTTYTASGFMIGCGTVNATVTVVVGNSISAISILTPTTSNCSGTALTLTANVTPPGNYTYLWSAPISQTTQVVTFTPTDNVIYNVTVSNATCQSTVTTATCLSLVSNECCMATELTMPTSTITNQNLSGAPVAITGTVTISGNVQWDNCKFKMSSTAKIIILSGAKLVLNNTKLFSCQGIWEGIVLNGSTAYIEANNSRIEDAYKAIYYDVQNGTYNDNIKTTSTVFNKNYYGIVLTNAAQAGTLNVTLNDQSAFTSSASITSPGNSLKCSNFYTPVIKSRGYAGIHFVNFPNFTIGTTNTVTPSYFDNLDYGYYGIDSYTRIYNCHFNNFTNTNTVYFPAITSVGVAIYATNTGSGAFSGINVFTGCKFTNVWRAIETKDLDHINVLNALFTNTTTSSGFCTVGCIGNTAMQNTNTKVLCSINQNTITNFSNGVANLYTQQNSSPNFSLSISQNTISASGSGISGLPIFLSDAVNTFSTAGAGMIMANNQISNSYNGIYVVNVKNGLRISNNTIAMTYTATGTRYGLRLNGTEKAIVDNNTIGTTSTANANLTGIYMQISPSCSVQCNNINSFGKSVLIEGNCLSSSTGFINNKMTNAQDGLVLKSNGIIGKQGINTGANLYKRSSGNQWLGTFSNSKTIVMDAGSSAQNSNLVVLNNTNEYPQPQTLNKVGLTGGALQQVDNFGTSVFNSPATIYTITNTNNTCMPPQTTGFKTASPDSAYLAYLQSLNDEALYQLISGPGEDAVIPTETKEINRSYVYGLMSTGYNTTHVGLQQFYNQQADSALGDYNDVDSLLLTQNYYAAQNQNNQAPNNSQIQQNQQLVNNALIKYNVNPQAVFTQSELDELMALANSCPLQQGTAVYQTRSLLSVLLNSVLEFEDNCDITPKNSQRKNNTNATGIADSFTLYPNPNNGTMTLLYQLNSNASLHIYDVSGRELYTRTLNMDTKSVNLNVNLAQGIYFYSIIRDNDTILKTDKLIILK